MQEKGSSRIDWKQRIRSNSKNCLIFHRRTQTGGPDCPPERLREDLADREKYLQTLVEQIVVNEQSHKQAMKAIDLQYGEQIGELHRMLQEQIERNRQLEAEMEGSSLNDSLLLHEDN